MPASMKPPATAALTMTCVNCQKAKRESRTAAILSSSIVPSGVAWYPTGCCIHAFAETMKKPEIHEPIQTQNADATYKRGDTRFFPYSRIPRKTDSRKKAYMPSIASGCPTTEPLFAENVAQFVPN